MTPFDRLRAADAPLLLSGVAEGYQPWLMATLARAALPKGRAVFIARDDAQAAILAEAATFFAPELETRLFPAWDCLPYDRAGPAARVTAERLATLRWLADPVGAKPQLLVTTVNAVLQRVLPAATVRAQVRLLKSGDSISRDALAALLAVNGYTRVDTVAEPGEYSVRGGLVDLYPAGESHAVRLDFFGDEIDSLRAFDPLDQRSIGRLDSLTLLPVSEVVLTPDAIRRFRQGYVEAFGAATGTDTLYQTISEGRRAGGQDHWLPLFVEQLVGLCADYLTPADTVVLDAQGPAAVASRFETTTDYYKARAEALADPKRGSGAVYKPLPPDRLYLGEDEWAGALERHRVHTTSPFPADGGGVIDFGVRGGRDFAAERAANANVFDAVRDHARIAGAKGQATAIVCYSEGSRERLAGLLRDHGLGETVEIDDVRALGGLAPGRVGLAVLPLEHGFETEQLSVLTEQDVLGDRLVRKRRKARTSATFAQELATLSTGDLVVHADHGIGRFEGLQTITAAGAPHDCVMLTYDGGDKLYVPVENIDVLTRYGSDSEGVTLDKLGGAGWQNRKAKLKQRIKEIAAELMKVAAARMLKQAEQLEPQAGLYQEFCAGFPYVETDDQARAITDVLDDLVSGRPMDRLVCGDVGFGKTEVALRAACVAAMAGKQVAVVCPTTLLARQHAATFADRFRGLPITVGALSRLVSTTDANRVKVGLAEGSTDIVVGTHALLGKTIDFKRLGLVIVDEEQHFGVVHKERLKQLRQDVHVLTLTATPIPRTLQMALTGLRELSVIATPPIDRLAVRTYVMPWDGIVVREALLREHFRGGQSFYVVPRIADLGEVEQFLREQVPEVKAVVAHGQMSPTEIEERMTAFVDRQYDVLVSTTIVESGLDIPNANTLIIHRADQFGLSQLYQLRGRVGRGKARAYAYMTTDPTKPMTAGAEKRLTVLTSLEGLGAGFQLASHDLDIRGAGNLLGDEQSGHIKEVGFELYQQMLEEALLAARAEAAGVRAETEEFSPQISVGASLLIPEDYVPDLSLRMALYRRLGDLKSRPEIDGFAAELIDRFGKLPQDLKNLLVVIEIKQHCRAAGIAKIDAGPRGAVVSFLGDRFANPAGLVGFLAKAEGVAKLRPDHKLVYARAWPADTDRLKGALGLAKTLAQIATSQAPAAPPAAAKPALKPPPPKPAVFKSKLGSPRR
jgi:transcription-repair coupling factor (superfamily II helicase)